MLASARRNWLVWFVVTPVVLWALVRVLGLDSGFPVVALMAFTPYSVQELTPKLARKLEQQGIADYLDHEVLSVAPGAPGTGIYSTFPLTRLDEGGSFGFRMPRARAELPDGSALRIVAVHPLTPGRGGIGPWERALERMPTAGRGAPWILIGDFNATLDHSQLRELISRGYEDAGAVAAKGLEPTWPADRWEDRAPGITIDHVLLDRRLDVVEYSVAEIPDTDHRPIDAVLALP